MVAAAIIGSTVVGAVGSAISADNQADATQQAAQTQSDSNAAAIAEQRRQYDLTRSDYEPWREAGKTALGQVASEIGYTPTAGDVMSDPGYQFGLDQGQLGLDRKAAAAGGRISGAALKAASTYATNYAATGYNAAYQRRQDRLNRLQALAGIGQTATAGSAVAGANSANAISGLLSNGGDAAAAAQLARGSIWGNAFNQIGGRAANTDWSKLMGGGGTFNSAGTGSSGGYDYDVSGDSLNALQNDFG